MKKKITLMDLKGALPKADKTVSLEDMDKTILQRSAGLLKGKLQILEDFDAQLPNDIQACFVGLCQAPDKIAEECAHLQDVPAYEMDDVPLSPEDIKHIREIAAPMLSKDKLVSERSINSESPLTPEVQAWLDVVPVGREFGSKDYDRLMEMDLRSEGMDEKK